MKVRSYLTVFIVFFLAFQSCVPNKKLVYLQADKDKPTLPNFQIAEYQAQVASYKVQYGDVLNIKVLSQDPASVQPFNVENPDGIMMGIINPAQLFLTGYTVDEKGNILFPLLGEIFVRDKTIEEIAKILADKIDKFATNALVKIKLVSFKVTVLGEVKNPGIHHIYNDRVSILEILGYSGDMTDLGNRHKIKLIRTIGSKVQVSNLDLTDRSVLESGNYFLLPNDVIYVEPMKAKSFRLNLPTVNLILATVTTLLVLYNIIGK